MRTALQYKGEKIMSDQTNNQPVQEEPSLSELLQIRRDKLAALREQGQDKKSRSITNRQANAAVGQTRCSAVCPCIR